MQLLRVEAALDDPEICTLADLIYAAVFDDSLWTTVLSKIADLVDAGPGILVRKQIDDGQGQAILSRMDPRTFADYFGYFARRNPLALGLGDCVTGSLLLDWETLPKAELVRTEYYNDFMRPRDLHAILGLVVWREGTNIAVISLARSPRQDEFTTAQVERLRPLMPHLCRAIRLGYHLPPGLVVAERRAAVIDSWHEAIMLVSPQAAVRYANRSAEQLLARQDGLTLVAHRLGALDPAADRRLQAAIALAGCPGGAGGGSRIAVPCRGAARPYGVFVTPVPERISILRRSEPMVMLTLIDLSHPPGPDPAVLGDVLGLSAAQTAIAVMLAHGADLSDIAATRGLSLHTVRRHVTNILHQTGAARQADLARLLAQLSPRDQPPWRDGAPPPGQRRLGPRR